MSRPFATLTSRLVLTAVLLVALVSLVVGVATTVAMRDYLTGQLDAKVLQSASRERGPGPDDVMPPPQELPTGQPVFFGNQEPGTEAEISEFCERNFGVSFPLFSKVDVNGDDAHPLFQWLKDSKGGMLGSKIKWNFTKFLVGRDGQVIDRYAPTTEPEKLSKDIEKAL